MDILDLKGKPVKVDDKPMTVEDCCLAALQHLYQQEQATLESKRVRFKLALKFAAGGELPKLTAEETVELMKCVGMYWNPLVVGRVAEVFDPKSLE